MCVHAQAQAAEEAARAAQEETRQRAEQQAAAARRAAELERKRRELPAEPLDGSGASVSTIVVRLPDGTRLTRRFQLSDALRSVYDWVDLQQPSSGGLALDSYWLAQNYPRQTFSNPAQTIEQAKLYPHGTLFVQEKQQ